MLTRSQHQRPQKRLGELHRRWIEANRLLAPAIETFPQLLILPVVLLVIGLLDIVLSSSVPISAPLTPILVAGILSGTFASLIGGYIVWTVVHGCARSETSPFQTTLSTTLLPALPRLLTRLRRRCAESYKGMLTLWRSPTLDEDGSASADISLPFRGLKVVDDAMGDAWSRDGGDSLMPHEVAAFHATLLETHDDDALQQSSAALISLFALRFPFVRPSNALFSSHGPPHHHLYNEARSIAFLLSPEASIRSNLTAAAAAVTLADIRLGMWSKPILFRRTGANVYLYCVVNKPW